MFLRKINRPLQVLQIRDTLNNNRIVATVKAASRKECATNAKKNFNDPTYKWEWA